MALTPGPRLGPYEVGAQIGVGGMGEVYRATDTNLGRQVAIKVLPDAVAQDAERLARFDREARTLATLNHPGIAQIYGVEKQDGQTALVMELVEGPTLADRIVQGAIPVDEVLPIAKQIAEALEAAHERGIIHRDLKPANIKVRADGTVKVLDFGLAKAMEPAAGSSPSMSMSPTITTPAMTQAGVILGTAAYMSPEQARSKAVDKRADIWAFGAVLFEMLTGRRVFTGDDVSETLASVLKDTPDVSALPASVPTRLRALLRRSLERDVTQRLRDIGEARIVLDRLIAAAPDDTVSAALTTALVPTWRRALPWALASALGVVAVLALWAPWRTAPVSPETRVDIITPSTTQPGSLALSPDGRQIVFVAADGETSRLWLRPLATTTAKPLAGTEGASRPFWSPDSRSVGFFATGALKRLDLDRGVPQVLAPATNGQGGTWNADGVILFAPGLLSPLLRVAATGGEAVAVTTLGAQELAHFFPQFLPDGRRFLFGAAERAGGEGIFLGALDGRAPTRLTSSPPGPGLYAYVPSGFLLWTRAGTLVAQQLDLDPPALVGEPATLADQSWAVSVSATGLVAYRTFGDYRTQLTWFDRSGTAGSVIGAPGVRTAGTFRLSPDGRRVAVQRRTASADSNLNIWLLDGLRASRLTFNPGNDAFPVWAPDGARIVYRSIRPGQPESLFQTLTNGTRVEEPLLQNGQSLVPTSWSADGKFVLYSSVEAKSGDSDLWVLPMSGTEDDRTPFVFLKTAFREAYGEFSPDGRWVAYHSNETGRPEVYVRPFVPPGGAGTAAPSAAGQWQVSTAGGIHPVWRADGKELYYLNPDGALMAVPITVAGGTLAPSAPVMLFATHILYGGTDAQLGRQYGVARDGRFLINTVLNETAAPITLIQNWRPPAGK